MKNVSYLLLLVFLLPTLSCEDAKEKCNSDRHKDVTYQVTAPVNAHPPGGEFKTSLSGNTRIFSWERVSDNVCIYSTVSTSFGIATFDEYEPTDFSVRAYMLWGFPILSQSASLVTTSASLLQGIGSAHLESSFIIGAGSFTSIIEISFPTKGNHDLDIIYLLSKVRLISITPKFFSE